MAITVTQQDPRYQTLKKSRNLRMPASDADFASRIELCETASDTAEALQRIVSAGLRPTVRCGGHCYEDFVVNNPGGAILDFSLLQESPSGEDGARYRINPGKQLGDIYLDLYKRYGVTIPAGTCYSVGAGGHISGGGYGVLSRLHGLTTDWVSAVDILTVDANGKVIQRRVDKQHDPDLFRACRGAGGGNFGVATAFEFELHPIPGQVFAGSISFPFEQARQVLAAYGDYSSAAPNALYVELYLAARANPAASQLRFNICFSGSPAEVERALRPVRRFGDVLRDDVKAVSYPVAQKLNAHAAARPNAAAVATDFYGQAAFLEGFGEPLAEAIVESLASYPECHVNMLFIQAGGAISQRPIAATAFSHRGASHDMAFAASWNSRDGAERQLTSARQIWAHLQPFARGFYVNDMAGAVTPSEVAANYGANAARLSAIKTQWDPQNLFRLNANILPKGVS